MFGMDGGGFFGGGGGGGPAAGGGFFGAAGPGRFERQYQCFPLCFLQGKEDLEKGNKIILPQSALDHLARLNISYPMLFEVCNPNTERRTHVGVQEFMAEEGTCYLPYWLMCHLQLAEEDLVQVTNTTLPKGTFVKLQPCSKDFLDIHNPRAVLENTLRNFATLTVGDCIVIDYNSQRYEIDIIEAKPANAISIIEADVNVDFAPPKDYVEPARPDQPLAGGLSPSSTYMTKLTAEEDAQPAAAEGFQPFGGGGQRVDGRAVKQPSLPALGSSSPPAAEEEDEQPWRKRIPQGVKYTRPPFGSSDGHMSGAKSPARHVS